MRWLTVVQQRKDKHPTAAPIAANCGNDHSRRCRHRSNVTFDGTTIATGTDSYRLAGTRARAEAPVEAG
ncbi:hypothetical protein SAMN05216252_13476 [Actinacidiphila glaucinigra]|uniref:Uncharacterized protein n=1 Tax=Actinacidiphila glaucinigra TaxID=235986 RepID=A0A239NDT0_9ACTN|nr:hypothetical protein [Actinacidiphila glaucinigra]SNT53035.1 hypothetical protein SAMN05216252_13476 [Actinacidiphila glaucinigra]